MSQKALGKQGMVYCAPAMPVFLIGATVDGKPNFLTAAWLGIACGKMMKLN